MTEVKVHMKEEINPLKIVKRPDIQIPAEDIVAIPEKPCIADLTRNTKVEDTTIRDLTPIETEVMIEAEKQPIVMKE